MPSLTGSSKIAPVLISGLVSASSYSIAVAYSRASPTRSSNVMLPLSLSPSSSAMSVASGSEIVPSSVFSACMDRTTSGLTSGTRNEAK